MSALLDYYCTTEPKEYKASDRFNSWIADKYAEFDISMPDILREILYFNYDGEQKLMELFCRIVAAEPVQQKADQTPLSSDLKKITKFNAVQEDYKLSRRLGLI